MHNYQTFLANANEKKVKDLQISGPIRHLGFLRDDFTSIQDRVITGFVWFCFRTDKFFTVLLWNAIAGIYRRPEARERKDD